MSDFLLTLTKDIQEIIQNPLSSLAIIGNLIIMESLLSVDNAAVLATMVMDLKQEEREKALRYGIIGAYVFRGLALLFAAFLIQFWFLKPIGGLYLLYLVWDWWKGKQTADESDDFDQIDKSKSWIYRMTIGWLGNFWATVALVEVMDMAFSIDNVFAVVAFTDNILMIWIGVFIGILAMRFVAQGFVHLMEKYTFLETSAFLVIGILGVKLILSVYEHFYETTAAAQFLKSHEADWAMTIITISIFVVPIIGAKFFGYPKVHDEE